MVYRVCHGLAPYLCQELLSCQGKCDFIVVSFDMVFNKVSEKGQGDLVSRYWDGVSNKMTVRYLNSAFMDTSLLKIFLNLLNLP